MKKTFEVTQDGQHIKVENTWFNGERLYVDGELQDENLGLAFGVTLTGKLNRNNGDKGLIKVSIGGNFKINCRIFVDNKLIFPTDRLSL